MSNEKAVCRAVRQSSRVRTPPPLCGLPCPRAGAQAAVPRRPAAQLPDPLRRPPAHRPQQAANERARERHGAGSSIARLVVLVKAAAAAEGRADRHEGPRSCLSGYCGAASEAAQIFGGASYVVRGGGGQGEKVERLYREARGQRTRVVVRRPAFLRGASLLMRHPGALRLRGLSSSDPRAGPFALARRRAQVRPCAIRCPAGGSEEIRGARNGTTALPQRRR